MSPETEGRTKSKKRSESYFCTSTLKLWLASVNATVSSPFYAMSLDWMRLTPASVIFCQAAASELLRSMARVASSIT